MADGLEHYRRLQRTAIRTQGQTDRNLRGVVERFPRAIDCMLKVSTFLKARDPSKPTSYEWWAARTYISAAHSFFASLELLRSGLYIEAETLQRRLVEVLAQMHFFASRHAEFEKHLYAGVGLLDSQGKPITSDAQLQAELSNPQRVKRGPRQFKQIFDPIAPGYYEAHYGTDSNISHGGAMAVVGRFWNKEVIALECIYDERDAGGVINKLTALLYGYVQQAQHSFPAMQLDDARVALVARVTKELDEMLVPDPGVPPEHHEWLRLIGPLIRRPAPAASPEAQPTTAP